MERYKFSCRNGTETSVCKRNILYVWVLQREKGMDPGSTLLGERCCHQRLVEHQATETPSRFQKIEDFQRKHQMTPRYSLEQVFIILHWKI